MRQSLRPEISGTASRKRNRYAIGRPAARRTPATQTASLSESAIACQFKVSPRRKLRQAARIRTVFQERGRLWHLDVIEQLQTPVRRRAQNDGALLNRRVQIFRNVPGAALVLHCRRDDERKRQDSSIGVAGFHELTPPAKYFRRAQTSLHRVIKNRIFEELVPQHGHTARAQDWRLRFVSPLGRAARKNLYRYPHGNLFGSTTRFYRSHKDTCFPVRQDPPPPVFWIAMSAEKKTSNGAPFSICVKAEIPG